MYEIETEDFYKDVENDVLEKLDTSNFPKDHFLYTNVSHNLIFLGDVSCLNPI